MISMKKLILLAGLLASSFATMAAGTDRTIEPVRRTTRDAITVNINGTQVPLENIVIVVTSAPVTPDFDPRVIVQLPGWDVVEHRMTKEEWNRCDPRFCDPIDK